MSGIKIGLLIEYSKTKLNFRPIWLFFNLRQQEICKRLTFECPTWTLNLEWTLTLSQLIIQICSRWLFEPQVPLCSKTHTTATLLPYSGLFLLVLFSFNDAQWSKIWVCTKLWKSLMIVLHMFSDCLIITLWLPAECLTTVWQLYTSLWKVESGGNDNDRNHLIKRSLSWCEQSLKY